jgi:DNA-binding CsgD family transcriptional regulator
MLIERLQNPDLVASFYEAAASPERWNVALVALCEAFEADAGVLLHQPRAQSTPTVLAANPRQAGTAGGMARGAAWAGSDLLMGGEVAGIVASSGGGALHRLRASVDLDGGARAVMGLNRAADGMAFDDGERAALHRVAGHLAAALRLEARLATERLNAAARGAALDQFRHGALIVSGRGEVLFANFAAETMAEAGGLTMHGPGSLLSCADPGQAAALAGMIRMAAGGRPGGSLRVTSPHVTSSGLPGSAVLAATVSPLPLPRASGQARAMALVTVRDLSATSDAGQSDFMALFGLTAAEAALVPQLLAGDSVALIAQSRGVSAITVRAQVARLLDKTGAANLRALAAMMAAW